MTTTHTCRYCSQHFKDTQTLQDHKRVKHAIINVDLGGTPTKISPNLEGCYTCPCSFHLHPTVYNSSSSMISHIRQGKELLKKPPSEKPTFIGTDMIETPTLSQHNLAVNMVHRLTICLSCSYAVLPSQLKGHFQVCRQGLLSKREEDAITTVLESLDVNLTTLATKKEGVVNGINWTTGYSCTSCSAAFAIYSNIVSHYKDKHLTLPAPSQEDCSTTIQRLQNNNRSPWFAIQLPDPDAPIEDALGDLRNLLQPSPPDSSNHDPRNVCPWLRFSRWHELVEGKEIKDLRKLVESPKDGELSGLSSAILGMFQKATDWMDKTSDLTLQRINTEAGETL